MRLVFGPKRGKKHSLQCQNQQHKYTLLSMSKTRSKLGEIDHTIEVIEQSKQSEGQKYYKVKRKSLRIKSWAIESTIPKSMIDEYRDKKKIVDEKKTKKKLNKIKVQAEESDSFMNESDHEVISIRSTSKSRTDKSIPHDKQKKDTSKSEPQQQIFRISCDQNSKQPDAEIQLVAEVSSDDQSSSDDDDDDDLDSVGPKKGKQPKSKKQKQKQKRLSSKSSNKLLKTHVDQDNIIIKRNRPLQRKSYKQQLQKTPAKQQKPKINISNVLKDTKKAASLESMMISNVINSGMQGPYKFYLVRLRNNQKVYVREKDMKTYFPRKLHEFYQRILNKVSKSTQKLNFVL